MKNAPAKWCNITGDEKCLGRPKLNPSCGRSRGAGSENDHLEVFVDSYAATTRLLCDHIK